MFGSQGRARGLAFAAATFIAGTLVLNTAVAEPGVDKEQILIGAFGPLTGPASWIGLGARDGMALAAEEMNANGGVNGRKIRLQFEGAQTPAESVAAVKKLVEQNGVFALVLGSGSTGAAAAADYLREARVPSYNIVGATPKIRQPFSEHIFNGVFPSATAIAALHRSTGGGRAHQARRGHIHWPLYRGGACVAAGARARRKKCAMGRRHFGDL